ncbi:MAG TPA: sigma 54-interacting transcriptional regulator [Mucilaginibacter sp.]|jgi:transcriptional regulator with PAS, ATPase and Fis domain
MKILLSWIALMHDFSGGDVNPDGPTFDFYRNFFAYDRHIILSQAAGDHLKSEILLNKLKTNFPEQAALIELRYLAISDVININQIKTKVSQLMLELQEHELDIFYSPGTSAMQVAWYICHTTLGLQSRLLQTRHAKFTKTGKSELIVIETSQSTAPVTATLRQVAAQSAKPSKAAYLITASLQPVYDRADKIAQTDKVTTLITGDSGTGKEHLAAFIHNRSDRNAYPFIPVNCAAFTDELLEARLFGYKKGAYTGADKEDKGLFQSAAGGSIFLDEIGDISPYMQQSLLRVLQAEEILPLGFHKPVKTDVRIIAATNKDLPELCRQGRFRWDLYYRLTVTELNLPNLQQRQPDEKLALLDFFLRTKKLKLRKARQLSLSKEAKVAIALYPFPGNIREMENLVEQLYVFHDSTVALTDLPERLIRPAGEASLQWTDVEKELISKVMTLCKGNKNLACKTIGYASVNTLNTKMRQYGL